MTKLCVHGHHRVCPRCVQREVLESANNELARSAGVAASDVINYAAKELKSLRERAEKAESERDAAIAKNKELERTLAGLVAAYSNALSIAEDAISEPRLKRMGKGLKEFLPILAKHDAKVRAEAKAEVLEDEAGRAEATGRHLAAKGIRSRVRRFKTEAAKLESKGE